MDNNIISIISTATNDTHGISIVISKQLTALTILAITLLLSQKYIKKIWPSKKLYTEKEHKVSISIAGVTHSYTIERNTSTIEIAHKIYIELITRKAAIPFDEDNDIIEEVYNSWYNLFSIIREEIKHLNGDLILSCCKTKELVKLSTDILNKGLRPHLTQHQGRFRKWIKHTERSAQAPQTIQRGYPEYETLVRGIKDVNTTLISYSNILKELIYEETGSNN